MIASLTSEKTKKLVYSFLKTNNLFPFERNWNEFNITHPKKLTDNENIKVNNLIRDKVGNKSGVYLYCRKTGSSEKLLYIGKAKPLSSRIYSHYRESFSFPDKVNKGEAWPTFFSKYTGRLKIYWIEIQDERVRRIIEEMLEYCFQSQFDKEYPRGKRNLLYKINKIIPADVNVPKSLLKR